MGAQRADTVVDLLAAGLGIDPWTAPVAQSSFLTEEQVANGALGCACEAKQITRA